MTLVLITAFTSIFLCVINGENIDGPALRFLMTEAAKSNGAVCLDGSPGAYYFTPGTGDGVNKWYIHHEGGGWCESMDDCLARSKTGLGSSTGYPKTTTFDQSGYFSSDEATNPLMWSWNKVLMRYCDGASFSGNNETVAVYKGTPLYWRGDRVRKAIANDLFVNRGLANASDLVVSGCSAGGLATYLHTDQWCDKLATHQPNATCVGLPDSGFFLDYQDPDIPCSPTTPGLLGTTIDGDYHCGLKWVYLTQNATVGVNQGCLAARKANGDNEEWRCMFAEHSAAYIRRPVFALQSQYDSWQTGNVQGLGGANKTQILGNNITFRLEVNLLAHNKESGAFLDSCHHHCGAWNQIRIDGDLSSTAMMKWYQTLGQPGAKKLWNQNKPYPCEECCKGVTPYSPPMTPVS